MTPRIVVVSGPSGVGKTTVCAHLLRRRDRFERVVTATTRAARGDERDGVDYLFLDDARFDEWVAADRFLEWANVHGKRYGSPREQAEAILRRGRCALLNIDVQGAASVRRAAPEALLVFLAPPSWEELERRLRGRGTDDPGEVERRLAGARAELARRDEFDHVVVNVDSRTAADEIATLVGA